MARQDDLDDTLMQCINRGDAVGVRAALRAGADSNAQQGNALQQAVRLGHSAIAELLLRQGADAESGQDDVLQVALDRNDAAMIRALADGGVDINHLRCDEGGYRASTLHIAIRDRDYATAETLVKAGADVRTTDEDGWNALEYAILQGDAKMQAVLESRAHPRTISRARGVLERKRRRERYDQLLTAIQARGFEAVKTLVESHVDPQGSGTYPGDDATTQAAGTGDLQILEYLLDHGGRVNGIGKPFTEVPIVRAASSGSIACVELLLARGADINANCQSGTYGPPLLKAAQNCDRKMVEFLIGRGASVGACYGWATEDIERQKRIKAEYPESTGPSVEELDLMQRILDQAVGLRGKADMQHH